MPSRKVIYDGQTYESVKALADHLGLTRPCLRDRINNGWAEKDWAIPARQVSKPIKYQGQEYQSEQALSRKLGIDRTLLQWRIKNWQEKDWAKAPDLSQQSTCREIIYQDQKYSSIAKLARKIGISEVTLAQRIDNGWPEKRWSLPGYSKDIKYMGEVYASRWQLCLALSDQNTDKAGAVQRKLATCLDEGMDIDEAVEYATTNQNITPIKYQGKTYPTLTSLAEYLGKHIVTLQNRIKKGWPEKLWAVERLPKTAPDFYFFLNNPEYDDGECSFYIASLKNYTGFVKIGIAKSYIHRADREYGSLLLEMRFKTRFEAIVLEQSILHLTNKNAECPQELSETDPPWDGQSEVRKVDQDLIESLALKMANEMDDMGAEDFAIKYIPMSKSQAKLLANTCRILFE